MTQTAPSPLSTVRFSPGPVPESPFRSLAALLWGPRPGEEGDRPLLLGTCGGAGWCVTLSWRTTCPPGPPGSASGSIRSWPGCRHAGPAWSGESTAGA